MNFILASANEHKSQELSSLLATSGLCVSAASKKIDVIEDGESFSENAFKKAQAYYEHFKSPVVSDDSGLIVQTLPGELGIHTARFGGEGLSDEQRSKKLLEQLEEQKVRNAYFICLLCFYFGPDEYYFFEGRLNGEISHEYKGDQGFGYDPVFIPEAFSEQGQTLAQLGEWKSMHSHRAQACFFASKFFENFQI